MTDHLRAGLEADADVYEVPPGDLDRVRSRGRRRDQRRRRLTGSVAALAVLAGTFTAARLADNEPTLDVAAEVGSAALGDSGIAWERVDDPDAALGGLWQWPTPVVTDDGVFALSTAPGERNPSDPSPRVVWRSDDGVDWTPVATPNTFWMTDLSASDGRLYAIGTGPATQTAAGRKVHDVRVGSSAGGAGEWSQQSLPLGLEPIVERSTSVRVDAMDVAAGPNGIVAVVSVLADLDVRALLGVEAPNGWTVTAEGINVLGDGECPAGTSPSTESPRGPVEAQKAERSEDPNRVYGAYCEGAGDRDAEEVHGVVSSHSWAELDLPADVEDAVLARPFAFHSADDGATWERVALPVSASAFGGTTYVEPTEQGFTVVASRQPEIDGPTKVEVLQSADGRTWDRQAGAIPGLQHVAAIGTVDGTLALVGHGRSSSLYAELHPDGWRVASLADVLGVTVSDERTLFASSAAIGPLGVVVVASVPGGEWSEYRLLASRDGEVWSSDLLADLAGRDDVRGASHIVMQGDRVAVSVRTGTPGQEVTGRLAIVGTPR